MFRFLFLRNIILPAVLWNRNDLLRFRFRFRIWKSFCSSSDSGFEWIQTILSTVINCTKSCLFTIRSRTLFPKKLSFHFGFSDLFDFCIPFYVGSKSGTETRMHYGSGFAKAKSSCSGSTTLLSKGGLISGLPIFIQKFMLLMQTIFDLQFFCQALTRKLR
jgi:hypothetical protein